jgi:predicted Holliday junction resolvase-like endonuclease
MKNLSVIVAIALIFALPSCKFLRSKGLFKKKADVLTEWQAKQDSTRVADSIKQVQDKLLAVEIENARIEAERKAEEERLELERRKYNIVVGSFITPQYARDYAEVYRKLGYNPEIIKMEGTSFELVVAERYESFSKAFQRLNQFQDTVDIDTWLYIMR